MNQTIKEKKTELDGIKAKLAAKESALDAAEDENQARLRKAIEEHEALVRRLQRDLPIKTQKVNDREAERDTAERELHETRAQFSYHNENVQKLQNTIKNLEGQAANRNSAFGHRLELVFNEIDRATWVHSKPLGPLGMYVQLEDHRYKDIVSTLLGSLLCSFAVRHARDKQTLMNILRQCVQRGYRPGTNAHAPPPVILHSGDLFDFSSGDMRRYGETVLSKLKVGH